MIHAGSALVTGANRGIGLGLVREYLSNHWLVHACCRTPSESVDLRSLVETYPSQLWIHQVDVTDPGQIERLNQDLCGIPLDLLINNAAVYGQRGATLFNVDVEVWRTVHATNVVGPALMTRALLANLEAGSNGTIVNVSSCQGSVAGNGTGRKYAYRTSKTALNMLTRCLAIDLQGRGLRCFAIDPGWVATRMGTPGALIDVAESARSIRTTILRVPVGFNGGFIDHHGEEIPW